MKKLLEKGSIIIVLGTGGVGKTTVTAALGIAAAARERPVTRPGITQAFGAAHEQDGMLGLGCMDNGDGGFRFGHQLL